MNFTYNFAKINEHIPMIEFLESLPIKERAKLFAAIDKLIELKNHGLQPKENLSKHLEDGIFELRVSFENRIARSLLFYEFNRELIFTRGFIKKEPKNTQR
jgi:phage-related protein